MYDFVNAETPKSYLRLTHISSTEIALELYLNSSTDLQYTITLHDPQFFWQTYNGLTIPKASYSLKMGDNYLVVAATEYVELDRREARCEEEQTYSFTACVRVRPGPALLTDCNNSLNRPSSVGSLAVGLPGIPGPRPPYLSVQMSASCWSMKNY